MVLPHFYLLGAIRITANIYLPKCEQAFDEKKKEIYTYTYPLFHLLQCGQERQFAETYIHMYVPGRRSGTLGRNFATRLLTCSVFSYFLSFLFIFWLHCKNIIHNLTLKRKKKENTEQVRSLVAKLLPSLPLGGKAHTYVYRFQQIETTYSHYSK